MSIDLPIGILGATCPTWGRRVSFVTRVHHRSDDGFPSAPALGDRQQPSAMGGWLIVSVLLPVGLGVALLPIGFGLGTSCTDIAGNGGLSVAPCSTVDHGIKLGLLLQAAIWLAATIAAWRSRRSSWMTRLFLVASLGAFTASVVLAGSY